MECGTIQYFVFKISFRFFVEMFFSSYIANRNKIYGRKQQELHESVEIHSQYPVCMNAESEGSAISLLQALVRGVCEQLLRQPRRLLSFSHDIMGCSEQWNLFY